MTLTPEQMLENTAAYLKNLEKARSGFVAVGLPAEKIGGKVYGDGQAVATIGARHEYGAGVPRRLACTLRQAEQSAHTLYAGDRICF